MSWSLPIGAQTSALKLGLVTSLGDHASHGRPFRDGIRLAVEEANQAGGTPIIVDIIDDGGTDDGARTAATRLVASDALGVVGPLLSTSSLAAGPIFAEAGLVSIVSTVESDLVTRNATTFHANFKNSEIGDWLADYAHYALGRDRAAVIYVDNGYGQTIAQGFKRGAAQRGIEATFYPFTTPAERDEAGRKAAAMSGKAAIVLGTLDADAAALVTEWRRRGVDVPILGGTGLADEAFAGQFKNLPEERQNRGFFTKSIYAAAPVILDSANARTLDFATRFEARFREGETSAMWSAVQGYDAGRLAVAALRAAAVQQGATTLRARRDAVYAYLKSLDSPARGAPGLLGPIWFTPDRGRPLPVRIGRFDKGLFESAPIQLVLVENPAPEEIANGTLIEVEPGRYARRQQVVYTGIYLNELSRIDIAQSAFTADFYVWVRFAKDMPGSDPTRFEFPDMVRGRFDRSQPASQRDLDDGTTYRLWRVGGDFKNDYDLRRYPADHQTLNIRFFNAGASSDRLVYVVDRSSLDPAIGAGDRSAARGAFRNLTQWERLRIGQGRENLVTESSVGDPGLAGAERGRELSGFALEIEVKRHIGTTLIKTLLPLGLMTFIMFATLFFPPAMAVAKVTVAITAGLSGAVLLAAINGQLGNVGYVIAVEYGFFVFFTLCLTCIVTVLLAERNRLAGRSTLAIEHTGRAIFVIAFLATMIAAFVTFG